ncbi:MAG TPA: hypothetical protein DIT05_02155 [Morganella sp. (in: Bacteria)]|nr:hypothetical protein [Morganella sp. (in: enterobacteria)]
MITCRIFTIVISNGHFILFFIISELKNNVSLHKIRLNIICIAIIVYDQIFLKLLNTNTFLPRPLIEIKQKSTKRLIIPQK